MEDSAEAGDLDAQKRLAEIVGLESFEEYKKCNQKLLKDIMESSKFPHEDLLKSLRAATRFQKDLASSSITQSLGNNLLEKNSYLPSKLLEEVSYKGQITSLQKTFNQISEAIVDKSALQNTFNQISEAIIDKSAIQNTLRSFSAEKLGLVSTTQKLAEEAYRNLINPQKNRFLENSFIDTTISAPVHYPSLETRIADEIAEGNRVNKEILKELRQQNRSAEVGEEDLRGFHSTIEPLKEPFDILDTTLSRSLDTVKSKWSGLEIKRILIASAMVKYLLYWNAGFELDPIYLGHITLRKMQDDITEVAIQRMVRGERAIPFIETVSNWKAHIEFDKKVAQAVRERGQKESWTNKDNSIISTQKGRYRLTKEEIKRRKKIVKEANNIFKESDPKKTWKQIAYELDIPERTLRDWRHNPLFS